VQAPMRLHQPHQAQEGKCRLLIRTAWNGWSQEGAA
jgi:hypothetical protein